MGLVVRRLFGSKLGTSGLVALLGDTILESSSPVHTCLVLHCAARGDRLQESKQGKSHFHPSQLKCFGDPGISEVFRGKKTLAGLFWRSETRSFTKLIKGRNHRGLGFFPALSRLWLSYIDLCEVDLLYFGLCQVLRGERI